MERFQTDGLNSLVFPQPTGGLLKSDGPHSGRPSPLWKAASTWFWSVQVGPEALFVKGCTSHLLLL